MDDSYVYFYDLQNNGKYVRVGYAGSKKRLTQHHRMGQRMLALLKGTKDLEQSIHSHFRGSLARDIPNQTSIYVSSEIMPYVEWLLSHGYAASTWDDVSHIPCPSISSIHPLRAIAAHGDANGSPQLSLLATSVLAKKTRDSERVFHQSKSDEWYTPPVIIESARRVMGSIDTDPASSPLADKTVRAATYYSSQCSGLNPLNDWHGNVWLNPPYGGEASSFVLRLIRELRSGSVSQACLLLNAGSMSSKWFAPIYTACQVLMITLGRIDFIPGLEGQAVSSSGHGTVIAYFGDRVERFADEFSHHGHVLVPWNKTLP
jgi:hypothetical protein